MSKNVGNFIKVLISNALLVCLGILQSFLLPNILGPAEYGKWSLYLVYTGYAGFFSFGFCDGLLLVFGGKRYNELNKKQFKGYYITHFLFLISLFLIYLGILFLLNIDDLLLFALIGVACVFSCQRDFFEAINVSTNRMTHYSIGHIIEKVFILFGILACFFLSISKSIFVVAFAVAGWFVTVVYNLLSCRLLILNREPFRVFDDRKDYFSLCSRGIFITFASVGISLMTGFGKMFVGWAFGDSYLGYYSFVFSTSALFAVFFNALSTIFYPIFKSKNSSNSISVLNNFSFAISFVGVLLLLVYFALYWFIGSFFPKYQESLPLLFVLIPMVVIQGKNNSIYITLYKLYDLEKFLALNLLVSVGVCMTLTAVLYSLFASLISVAIATYLSLVFLLCLNHVVFNLKSENNRLSFCWLDFAVHGAFLLVCYFLRFNLISFLVTIALVIAYAFINLKRIRSVFTSLFQTIKQKRGVDK